MYRIVPRSLIVKLGWTTTSYGVQQVLRLVNNVVLARLLAPSLFGVMILVNSIRTGIELLSDIGINQQVIRHEKGDTPVFYDTAWTLQMIRGLALGTACFFLSGTIARILGVPELAKILPMASLFFLFVGLESTGRLLLNRRLDVARISQFEMGIAAASVVTHIVLALITPTIWGLMLASVFNNAVILVCTFVMVPGIRHRLILDRATLRELLVFGRWIFISSMIYFASMNFDRLYFARHISLAQLGMFGIARTLSDAISLAFAHSCNLILFPYVAGLRQSAAEVRNKLRKGRRHLLFAAALGLAAFAAVSDLIVGLLYDPRYAEAGTILPVLVVGTWFAVLSEINNAILFGMGHLKLAAGANAAKLLTFLVGVPLALANGGFQAAILVLSAGELMRYLSMWSTSRREGLGFARDDLPLTILFFAAILGFRSLFAALGLTSGIAGLFPLLGALAR